MCAAQAEAPVSIQHASRDDEDGYTSGVHGRPAGFVLSLVVFGSWTALDTEPCTRVPAAQSCQ